MDPFTEKILERARERQKMIGGKCNFESPISKNKSECNKDITGKLEDVSSPNRKNSDNGNAKRIHRRDSKLKVLSRIVNSPGEQNTLNIQNDNIDVEIKVRSNDNVRIEVEVQEEDDEEQEQQERDSNDSPNTPPGISDYGKGKLQRFAKLYTDGDISSPIHRTEEKFNAAQGNLNKNVPVVVGSADKKGRKCIGKLAQLAETISHWEDDVKPKQEETKPDKAPIAKKTWKPPTSSPSSKKSKATDGVKWDKNILDKLESQGFSRTESNSKLIYKFKQTTENKVAPESSTNPAKKAETKNVANVANKVHMFENSPTRAATKDPALLSIAERKALFEKNSGAALLPKAPFGMAIPVQSPKKQTARQEPPKPAKPEGKTSNFKPETPTKVAESVGGGIASKVAALLENKNTISQRQIESDVKRERQKEMDVLLNRHGRARQKIDEENSELSDEESAEEESPPRPERVLEKRKSHDKRMSDSPQVTAVLEEVKRIRVSLPKEGRLYPCLSDIEGTETEVDQEINTSSEDNYSASFDGNSSYERAERSSSKRPSSSEDSFLLSDMDEYLNAPMPDLDSQPGPTPPKQGRILKEADSGQPSHSFNYKNFGNAKPSSDFKSPLKISAPRKSEVPIQVVDGDDVLPLTHTVSFYRKQQNQIKPSVRQVVRHQPLLEEDKENVVEEDDRAQLEDRIAELAAEIRKQELIIAQTSQALNLCTSTVEFAGSTEQVEAERVLLLASHRRQGALHEIQRLKVEGTLKQSANGNKNPDKGTLTISNISFPLKREYVRALAAAGGKGHHVVCLVKCEEQVLATQVVSTVASRAKNPDMEIRIPGSLTLSDVLSDFTVTFEVYCLQAQEECLPHDVKYHINKKASSKLTPKKGKQESRLVVPPKESPGGPSAVKSTTFALMGYVVFSMQGINRSQWTLNKVPSMSPLEGVVEMKVSCEFSVEHRGFLTMFEDVSGFGAWHRRWCLLKGHSLSYWKYPDDEQKRCPINSIDLKSCITKQVGLVSREICARLHTVLLELERDAEPNDKNSLTTICKSDKTIKRLLLSADTKEERIEWTNMLNKVLSVNKK